MASNARRSPLLGPEGVLIISDTVDKHSDIAYNRDMRCVWGYGKTVSHAERNGMPWKNC